MKVIIEYEAWCDGGTPLASDLKSSVIDTLPKEIVCVIKDPSLDKTLNVNLSLSHVGVDL